MKIYKYKAIRANQTSDHYVFSFAALPKDILEYSEIERVGRDDQGQLKGFQRHQVATHIKEIRDYLSRTDALLPNAVIVAFVEGSDVTVTEVGEGVLDVTIKVATDKPGFIVDGQQRLTALSGIDKPGFQVFVSGLICKDYNELRQQFILINNTRPLPKTLIYELLPSVEGLPERFTTRKFAARIVDSLNFDINSSLRGEIRQHTNPKGVLSDMAVQKLVNNSASDGAIRNFLKNDDYMERSVFYVSEFFWAVRKVFGSEWEGMSPRTSRLRHGAGLVAMGFVMELLHSRFGACSREEFEPGLRLLKKHTSWTSGQWPLNINDVRSWSGIQNTPSDIDLLSIYLVRKLNQELRDLDSGELS